MDLLGVFEDGGQALEEGDDTIPAVVQVHQEVVRQRRSHVCGVGDFGGGRILGVFWLLGVKVLRGFWVVLRFWQSCWCFVEVWVVLWCIFVLGGSIFI